jgi:predicted phage tail protein
MMEATQKPITVILHGALAAKYGREHEFYASTPREAASALEANYPGFRRDFLEVGRWAILIDDELADPSQPDECNVLAPIGRTVQFVPEVEGQYFLGPLLLTTLFPAFTAAIGATATGILGGLLITGLLIGVSMLFAPKPKKLQGSSATATSPNSDKQNSYSFNGPANVTAQGVPVPVVYGQAWVGSVVVSASIVTTDYTGP